MIATTLSAMNRAPSDGHSYLIGTRLCMDAYGRRYFAFTGKMC